MDGGRSEQLFANEFAEQYEHLHADIWSRITRVHGTLFTVEQLKGIPFDYLYGPNDMEFWRLLVENFLDIACVLLYGLIGDEVQDAHTIPRFKNDVMKGPWLDPAKRDLLQSTLKERKFDKALDSIAHQIKAVRHDRIAHRLVDRQKGQFKDHFKSVSLDELGQLFDATHAQFGALSFGSTYATLTGDLAPGTIGGKPTRTCLDEVLDAVLRDSSFVRQPERRKEWWSIDREYMDPAQLQIMNECRKRVGLPEV